VANKSLANNSRIGARKLSKLLANWSIKSCAKFETIAEPSGRTPRVSKPLGQNYATKKRAQAASWGATTLKTQTRVPRSL